MKNKAASVSYAPKRSPGPVSAIRVKAAAGNPRRGWLTAGHLTIPVALGRGGILANKREGDGGTPRGSFRPRQLWWRGDRYSRPQTFLPARPIGDTDAWCEDPNDRHYNQPIRLDRGQGGDRLKRADQLYDFIIEIDHNTKPRIAGRGSAVFLHLARDNFGPTAGCVSMTRAAMLQLLKQLGPKTRIIIG
ncbi:L,D-transpeptidase family protein [Bradyrhizobium sp. 930_D9_N1_4]|uniref:L,D-transpeptidase family protein n=1 Tax=Bradyrhizobium sp. 930_D9_N1_4 TaxID=3240374 RepID=UPI003F8C4123